MRNIALYRFFATIHQEKVGRLRGGPVFDAISGDCRFGFGAGDAFIVHQETEKGLPMGPGIIFADLSVAINSLPLMRQFGKSTILVLDVHFALTEPERIFTFDDEGGIDFRSNESWEVAKFWANPEREAMALAEVAAADLVTVPFQHIADVLAKWNKNIVVLPDVHDVDSAVDFYSIFMTAMWRTIRRKMMSPLHRFVTAPFAYFARKSLQERAEILREKLTEHGWT